MTPKKATPKKSPRQAVAFVMRGHWWALGKIAATAFFGGAVEAAFLVAITKAALAVADGRDEVGIVSGWFLPLQLTLLLAVALIAARLALAAYSSRQSNRLLARVVAGIRRRLSRAFLESAWEVQQTQRAGSLQELMTGYSVQAHSLVTSISSGVVTGANLVALLATAVVVKPLGALAIALSVTVLGLFLRPLRSAIRRRARAATEAGMEFAVSVNEISELGLELHVFHVQNQAQERVGRAIEQARQRGESLGFVSGLSAPVYSGLAYLAIVGALAGVAALKTADLTELGAAMLVMLRSLGYGQAAQGALNGLSGAAPAIEELQRRLEIFDAGRRLDGGRPVGRVGPITMHRVSFEYQPGEPVLRDVSFAIMPEEVVGIVGPSGSGKSTLVQLLLGLRDPSQGRILADDRDVSTLDRSEWARKVTFVPQAAHLIAGTIAENIAFLREGVSEEDIERAARLAHLHDDIVGFPEGYQRQVGTHGGHLSGGQQQRLCIARALVEQPDVLILDEPTSALDMRSEHLVRTTLLSLKERMTVIVIAHRLSTLTICDRIMVIKDGELKDFGTPLQLERSSDFYREALTLSGMR